MIENKEYFFEKWKTDIEEVDDYRKYKIKQMKDFIENDKKMLKFDTDLFFKMVEKIIICGKKKDGY